MKIAAVLPAAGIGERMCSSLPKQYIEVNGTPILCHTLNSFLNLEFVDLIVVVSSPAYEQFVKDKLFSYFDIRRQTKLVSVAGGATRHRSIAAGLDYFTDREKPEIVIVNDAVRPIICKDLLKNLIKAANECGAAGPVCNLTSTVIKPLNGFLDQTLERSKYKNSEMPQVFKYTVLREAYDKCSAYDYAHGTECLDLVRKYTNVSIPVIEASASHLFKVTHKRDLYAVEGLLKESQIVFVLTIGGEQLTQQNITSELHSCMQSMFNEVYSQCSSNFRFQVDFKRCQILIFLHFCESFDQIKEASKLISDRNINIVYILIMSNISTNHQIRQAFDEIENIVFVLCQKQDFSAKQQNVLELVKFLSWNFSNPINKRAFFV